MLAIRAATVNDVPLLHRMILEFAEFEKLGAETTITEEKLARYGFGPQACFRVLVAEWGGRPAGYAIFYVYFNSFRGLSMFLEDIYVREEFRGHGIGNALMAEVATIALREECLAMCWEVLDWNQPAIDFYRKLRAEFPDAWKNVEIEGEALQRLASAK